MRTLILLFSAFTILTSCSDSGANAPSAGDWERLPKLPYIDSIYDGAQLGGTTNGDVIIASDEGENTSIFHNYE